MGKALKLTLIYGTLVASIISTYLLVEQTHSCDCLNKIFFSDLASFDLTTEGAKWALIRSLLAKIAAYLFIHAFIIMNLRIFTGKPSPATVEDSNSIKLVNRILSNTIEQSIIFVSLYAYFIFDRAGDRFSDTQLINFASWYLLARVVFSATYMLSPVIGIPNFRAFGFALNVLLTALLLELNFAPVTYLSDYAFRK